MKRVILLTVLTCAAQAWANLHLAPPDFDVSGGRAVFIDMQEAHHAITFDGENQKTTVVSTIKFKVEKEGMPIFDLVPTPSLVEVDGQSVRHREISLPGGVSKVRLVSRTLAPGEYTLKVANEISDNVTYSNSSVSAAFWIRDLKDRLFWEQYLPVNLEFDQHARVLELTYKIGRNYKPTIYANGTVTQQAANVWKIEYPAWYTAAAAYFHTTPKGGKTTRRFSQKSISGRDVPFTIYGSSMDVGKFSEEAKRVFVELEADYGPWPHEGFIAYGSGMGGMEHAGATMTSFGALDHEMLHSYFAKGVMPANGNSGWIDEAIASWRDNGYFRKPTPGVPANLAGRSIYARNTNNQAYAHGRAFLGYLDYLMQDKGGLKAFLRGYFQTYKYTLITTDHFINNLEFFSGLSLRQLFLDNVYTPTPDRLDVEEQNPVHQELSARQLKSLL